MISKFKADVTRKAQPQFKIQIQRSGETTWTDTACATSNPVEVTINPLDAGKPERINIRAFLMKNNTTRRVFGHRRDYGWAMATRKSELANATIRLG